MRVLGDTGVFAICSVFLTLVPRWSCVALVDRCRSIPTGEMKTQNRKKKSRQETMGRRLQPFSKDVIDVGR